MKTLHKMRFRSRLQLLGMATKRNVSTRQGRSSSRIMTESHDPMHVFKGSTVTVMSIAVISNPPTLINLLDISTKGPMLMEE